MKTVNLNNDGLRSAYVVKKQCTDENGKTTTKKLVLFPDRRIGVEAKEVLNLVKKLTHTNFGKTVLFESYSYNGRNFRNKNSRWGMLKKKNDLGSKYYSIGCQNILHKDFSALITLIKETK